MMKRNWSLFIASIFLSVIVIRIFSYLTKPYISFYHLPIYYFYIGLLIMLINALLILFLWRKSCYVMLVMVGSGIGITMDQFIFLIGEEFSKLTYWSIESLAGSMICLFLVVVISYYIFLSDYNYKNKSSEKEGSKPFQLKFYLIFFIISIIVSRMFVYIFPGTSLIVLGYEIHHLYIGTIALMIGLLILVSSLCIGTYRKYKFGVLLSSIGGGLAVDEYIFRVTGGTTDYHYWSFHSFLGTIVFVICIFGLSITLYILDKERDRNKIRN